MSAKRDFVDKYHDLVMDNYYEIIDRLKLAENEADTRDILNQLEKLIKDDPKFLDSYGLAADLHRELGEEKRATDLENKAHKTALQIILDKRGNWPATIEWGYFENRHIVRALFRWGHNLWQQNKTEESLEIFRKLLKSNLNDNIGARFAILAIRLNLKPNYDEKWITELGLLDGKKMSQWWNKNHIKFPDEFAEWEKYLKKHF